MKKLNRSQSISVGLLLFGMLFGAGNIIFPVMMGQLSGKNFLLSGVGFLITGVGLPILAVASFALSKKTSLRTYTLPVGEKFSYFFAIVLLLTIGPLFATPRTATVAFEVGIQPFVDGGSNIPLLIYSTIFFALVLFYSFRPSKILDIIGNFLAPLFLVLISILIVASVFKPMGNPADFQPLKNYESKALFQGILDGYNTMDILACIAFASTVLGAIDRLGVTGSSDKAREVMISSIVTVIAMSIIYLGLTYLGASSNGAMEVQANGGGILSKASEKLLGKWGQILLAATATVACLKTAIGLSVSISATFDDMFPNKLKRRTWTFLFVGISFLFANFGLNTIIGLSVPFLMFLYPIAITMIILWLTNYVLPLEDMAFRLTVYLSMIPAVFDFIKSTPEFISKSGFAIKMVDFAKAYIPFFTLGLGWVVPVALGLAISFVMFRKKVS